MGLCFSYVGAYPVVSQWFDEKRTLATSTAAAGGGAGGFAWSLATGAMIEHLGIAWASRITAVVMFVINFACALAIKDRNKEIKAQQKPFDYHLLKRPEFLLLVFWIFFYMFTYIIVNLLFQTTPRAWGSTTGKLLYQRQWSTWE